MKRGLLFLTGILIVSMASAQWRDTKHHLVLTAMAGGGFGLGSGDRATNYQLIARGMYYPKRIFALGAEAGFTQTYGQFSNFDAGSVNGFLHMKLPLGFYAEGGLGAVAVISDSHTYDNADAGLFWSLGYAKSLGSRVAVELQYRHAPNFDDESIDNLQRGLRFGLSLKL
jgi:hypothetical protein